MMSSTRFRATIRRTAKTLFAAAILLGSCPPVLAASITNIDLKTDGNAEPPGDVLDVAVVFSPSEDSLQLEVKAFLVDATSGEVIGPIEGSKDENRDEQGSFLLKAKVSPDPNQKGMITVPVVVPYDALKLPVGEHTIGYVASLTTARRQLSERPTRLTVCRVTDEEQTRIITQTDAMAKTIDEASATQVMVLSNGKLAEQTVTRHAARPTFARKSHQSKVDVPGTFERQPFPNVTYTWSAADQHGVPEVSNASDHPWIPLDKQPVPFVTNRDVVSPNNSTASRFGTSVSADLSYGVATVNIPIEEHHRGGLEVPSWNWPTW
jgi:hypothetical protein